MRPTGHSGLELYCTRYTKSYERGDGSWHSTRPVLVWEGLFRGARCAPVSARPPRECAAPLTATSAWRAARAGVRGEPPRSGAPFRKADAVRTKEVPSRSSLEPNSSPQRGTSERAVLVLYRVGTTTTRAGRRGSNERRDPSADRTSVKEVRRTSERPGDRTRPTGFVRAVASVHSCVRSQPANGDGGWPSRDLLGPGHLRG